MRGTLRRHRPARRLHQRASIAACNSIVGCLDTFTDRHTTGVADSLDVDATDFNRVCIGVRFNDRVGPRDTGNSTDRFRWRR